MRSVSSAAVLIAVFCQLVLHISAAEARSDEKIPLVFLDDPNAVCTDGSKAGYYLRRTTNPSSKDEWMLYLGGGAWCWSAENCYQRSKTSYGSSKSWPRHIGRDDVGGGPMSSNCSVNPTFCEYNVVMINYCDGNSFAGMLSEPFVYNNTKVFLKGRFILDALLRQLLSHEGLANASSFLLTGGSAGGLAVYLHSDSIRDRLVAAVPTLKKFGAVPISGFFLDQPNIAYTPMYQEHIKGAFSVSNATGGLSAKCVESYVTRNASSELWRCNFAEYVFPLSTVPTFVFNSKTDFWQVTCILNLMPLLSYSNATFNDVINGNCSSVPGFECINWRGYDSCSAKQIMPALAYQSAFLERVFAVPNFFRQGNGAYITSCYTHCEAQDSSAYTTVSVRNTTMSEALGRWWSALGDRTSIAIGELAGEDHVYVDCQWQDRQPYRCNPTCPGP
jgi:hypothetical protein